MGGNEEEVIEIEDKNIKKVFTEDLPKRKGKNNQIDWKKCIGHKVKFIYEDIQGEFEIVNYDSKRISIKYKNKDIFKIDRAGFINCNIGKLIGKHTSEFKIEIGQSFKGDKRDLTILNREYRKDIKGCNWKWYKYKCNICGWEEGWAVEPSLLNGIGCGCCRNLSAVLGINTIWDTDKWMISYVGEEIAKTHTYGSGVLINPMCPDCGRVKEKPIIICNIYKKRSIGCPCGDGQSYPNKFMFKFLEQLLNMEFETEFSPDWIFPKRYDFYFKIDDKKYIVEMDGSLGHGKEDNPRSGQTKEESQQIDDYKDSKASEHGIEVVRIASEISSLDFIKNSILKSKLSQLFDLLEINWLRCHEFACSNRVKEACKLKMDNNELSCYLISKIMKVGISAINRYLKQGDLLGWCNYNANESRIKGLIKATLKSSISNSKQVEMFKNEDSLGIFSSCTELEKQSEELFGIKLSKAGISNVCTGFRKSHKGYTFKHVGNDVS